MNFLADVITTVLLLSTVGAVQDYNPSYTYVEPSEPHCVYVAEVFTCPPSLELKEETSSETK